MPLNPKGKKALNLLILELGKSKGRKVFYSLEKEHPEWVEKWREQ